MSLISQIYGLANSVAYIRCGGSGINTQLVLQSLSSGFGVDTGNNGAYVYNMFITNTGTGVFFNYGFDNHSLYYTSLESSVPMDGYSQIGTAAIIYAYATFPNISESTIAEYINVYCQNTQNYFGGVGYNIDSSGIDYILSQFSLSGINAQITGAPTTIPSQAINYNWYNAAPLFLNPDLSETIIRDVENQYYYLSGQLIYQGLPTGLQPCIKYNSTIHTSSGDISVSVIQNTPCYDKSSYIGPVSGIQFFREFTDGPGSSGYFDTAMINEYTAFDETVLSPMDYSSNDILLYSNQIDSSGNYILIYSGVQIDVPGFFNPDNEYGYGHTNFLAPGEAGCAWDSANYFDDGVPFMRMHEGDNHPKLYWNNDCLSYNEDGSCAQCTGTGQYYNWTGWKFAPFELNGSWAKSFSPIKTNPQIDTGRVLKRALSTDNYYIVNEDGSHSPMTSYLGITDVNGELFVSGSYVGPPQLAGNETLPGFVFWETFDNTNFPDFTNINIRPAFLSGEQYVISDFYLFTGQNATHYPATDSTKANIVITQTIHSSDVGNYDDIFKKCLAMGDNFGNTASGSSDLQSNAGYLYTGYSFLQNGIEIGIAQLLDNAETIGAGYSTLNYINGYQSGVSKFYLSNQYGYIITGDASNGINYLGQLTVYSYFSNGVLSAVNTGWTGIFAPIPPTVAYDYLNVYAPIYVSQNVENYLPRYSSGPFLTYQNQFLYPNAQSVVEIYDANFNGFPVNVAYALTIKEETVREVFATSGLVGGLNNHVIIRANSNSQPYSLSTTMATPFIPNSSLYTYTYNWLQNTSLYSDIGSFFYSANFGTDCVNQDYVPSLDGSPSPDYCSQMNLNSHFFGTNSSLFNQGVKYTGYLASRTISGKIGQTLSSTPILDTQPVGGGLYWGYKSSKISGVLTYVPPIFDLSEYALNVTSGLSGAMIGSIAGQSSPAFSNNGLVRYGSLYDTNGNYNGKDPFFYEYVGGRIGIGADTEGGYHDKGVIGDAWYQADAQVWGQNWGICIIDGNYNYIPYRYPQNDQYLSLVALTSTGLGIYIRGMSYYPYYLNWKYQPFLSPIGPIGATIISKELGNFNGEYYFDLDLKQAFYPLKNANSSGLYSSSGLTLGPFDRDVELCITGKNSIAPSGTFIIDGELITNQYSSCALNYVETFYPSSSVTLDQAGRGSIVSTFKIVPSGHATNLNISGAGMIGLTGGTIITIRPRTCFGAVDSISISQQSPLISGDLGIMNSFNYITNGSENLFTFSNDSKFESLVGRTLSITTTPREEILYPEPGDDFDSILKPTFDKFGNKIYSQQHPTYSYWKIKTPSATFTGVRETTRVYISIDSISTSLGQIPYQTFQTIIPSGSCLVSGIFAYTGEAESAVISDGIYLSGVSGASSLSGIFTPVYISDTLQRLPSGIEVLPTGNIIPSQVLPAPSLLEERKNFFQITGNDEYVPIIPSYASGDYFYNAYLWPAWSDLALLNPEVVYEQMPPDDGNVFLGSYLTFSASQGQPIGTGYNPNENVTYQVISQYTFLDSTSTNAIYNTGTCIFSGTAAQTTLTSGNLSGILAVDGESLSMAINLGG